MGRLVPFVLPHAIASVERLPARRVFGRVTAVQGMLVEIGGIDRLMSIGDRCVIEARGGKKVLCEAIGFRQNRILMMPFGTLEGVGLGCQAEVQVSEPVVYPDVSWLGRVVNAMGEPVDGRGPLKGGGAAYSLRAAPPSAHARRRLGGKLDLGVRAMNAFLTMCCGQRMGVFSGSGIGKSILLAMLARYTTSDVNVIGLVGERGREVHEFLADDLGTEGLARSVVVVATSDESPLMRRQAAYLTMTVAEYFRDLDKSVLCIMDSITRFATAQREIGLSAGEPPTSKGYTPTVFAELPRLLERAGPGIGEGTITGLFSVLVEGDDMNEPIADAVRSILDGHLVLDRAIAERGRYPAINVLRSISRALPHCNNEAENALVVRARQLIAAYDDMAELIRLGAYRTGSDPTVDRAIAVQPKLEAFMRQDRGESETMSESYRKLATIVAEAA